MSADRARKTALVRVGALLAAALVAVAGCAGPAIDSTSVAPAPLSPVTAATEPAVTATASVSTVPVPALSVLPEPAIPATTVPAPATSAPSSPDTPSADTPSADTPSAGVASVASPAGSLVMPASRPVRLQIPAIGVDSGLLDLGLQDDGTMQVPPDAESAGWYTGAPTPGELGPAVIVAHVDWGGELGVFYYLRDLQEGDEITVTREDGTTAIFHASAIEQFDKSEFPTDAVYGDIDHAGLRLITCGGEFDPQARSYVDNIVVFAALQS